MTSLMALVVGVLYAAAIYMMLRRSIVKLVIGLVLLSNAANLLIFTAAGLHRDAPPLVCPMTPRYPPAWSPTRWPRH